MKRHQKTRQAEAGPMPARAGARPALVRGERTRMCCGLPQGLLLCLGLPAAALAQSAPEGAVDPVVVTGTRTATPIFEVPASISVVDGDQVRDAHLGANLSESMGGVPGLVARDRQNYAQDEQVEIRGFGARTSFGLQGLRVFVDGIPSTLPDGQGWVSNIDLNSVDRVEVLRGPYSALYGNSSGGVIQVFTQPGTAPASVSADTAAGSNGQVRESTRMSGTSGIVGYDADLTHFATDGYRPHSAAIRNFANARFDVSLDPDSHWTFVFNSASSPTAQDPLGLKRAQFEANPHSVDPAALQYNTRKTFDQTQVGAVYDRRLDEDDSLQLRVYAGHRNAEQFQAIPDTTQIPLTSPGAVIDLGRGYEGTDVHLTRRMSLAGGPLSLTAGLSYDGLSEARNGYLNYVGSIADPTYGVSGQMRRNESNSVGDFDQYAQLLWQFLPAWSATAGIRHSMVQFNSTDNPIPKVSNGDNNAVNYGATLPVIGLGYALSTDLRLYANAGRGFETPTLNQLAYRPNGLPGINTALQADSSDNYELGIEGRQAWLGRWEATLFHIRTANEIVTQTNTGGRAIYQNAGGTQRDGLELSWRKNVARDTQAQFAYTYLNARYKDAYLTCSVSPCPKPNELVGAGNAIPSIARSTLYADLGWKPPTGWQAGIEGRAASQMYVDDINSQAAAGYAIASLRGGYRVAFGSLDLSAFARVDNLFNRQYAGSVIVDETSLRFYEPAMGRNYLAGVGAKYRF
jgi:iron complex outermembrane receptor protein